jgi:hypothetical protein
MPSDSHEQVLDRIQSQPELLTLLVQRLCRRQLPARLRPTRSALRQHKSLAPDLMLRSRRDWALLELQLKMDPEKWHRWGLMLALMADEHRRPGDLVVLTRSAAVARWAGSVACWRSPAGTGLKAEPLVVLLDERGARRLLATRRPELAYFASWAVRDRRGPRALQVVEGALEVCTLLPAGQRAQAQADIVQGLGEPLTQAIKELLMRKHTAKPNKAYQELKAALEARARAESVLTVLRARGLRVPSTVSKRVLACSDPARLDRWLQRAVVVSSASELLG